jgi:hypothetical protein
LAAALDFLSSENPLSERFPMMGQNNAPSTPPGASESAFYNTRAVHDVCRLRFDHSPGEGRWIVAEIVPAAGTGKLWGLGCVIDSRTGRFVDPKTGREVPFLSRVGFRLAGTWALIVPLEDGDTPAHGTYRWDQPKDLSLHHSSLPSSAPSDVYDVFSEHDPSRLPGKSGGVIVTQYDVAKEGANPFRHVRLIPDDWQSDVKPAFDAFRRNEAPFSDATSPDEAMALVSSENDLFAVAAFRRVTSNPGSDPKIVQNEILAAEQYRRAAFVRMALTSAADAETALARVRPVIPRMTEVEGLRFVVAGIGAATALAESQSFVEDVCVPLFDDVRAHLEEIRGDREPDPYLRWWLDLRLSR